MQAKFYLTLYVKLGSATLLSCGHLTSIINCCIKLLLSQLCDVDLTIYFNNRWFYKNY